MNSNAYCIIMAGGVGKRFWPVSSKACPKQFCDILNTGKSFLRQTFERALQNFELQHIFVVTGSSYAEITALQLPELPVENILLEPFGKNTAPCIAYAAYRIARINPDAIMTIVPSDHFIHENDIYNKNIREGIEFIEQNGGLLTIGIKPTRPETGYGYIQIKKNKVNGSIWKVKTFTEKPDEALAQVFLESGDFLWNAGIFIWRIKDIINEFKEHLEDIYFLFESEYKDREDPDSPENIEKIYSQCSSISIDFGIMERSSQVYVISGEFGWSDVGTWRSFHEISDKDAQGNVTNNPETLFLNSSDCIVHTPGYKKVVVDGIDNCIIAEQDDIIMICKREREDDIRQFEDLLKQHKMEPGNEK